MSGGGSIARKNLSRPFFVTTWNTRHSPTLMGKHPYHSLYLKNPLHKADGVLWGLIRNEQSMTRETVNLIPSANYVARSVREALGSVMQSPNSEGRVGKRYYPGTRYVDEVERLCQERALRTFNLSGSTWAVNVQSLSHNLARLQACSAILRTHDRVMDLDASNGTYTSKYFDTISFANRSNVDSLPEIIDIFRPRALMSESHHLTSHPQTSKICRANGVQIIADMTETAGLVASGLFPCPFEHADIVVAGTQGSLRGPGGALIFSRRGQVVVPPGAKDDNERCSLEDAVHQSVFPGHQGGPHNHAIMAVAVALGQAVTPSFREYQRRVVANAQSLAARLCDLGYRVHSAEPTTQRVMVKPGSPEAAVVQHVLNSIGIATGLCSSDNSLHLGALAMSTCGFGPLEFRWIAEMIHNGVVIAQTMENARSSPTLGIAGNLSTDITNCPAIVEARRRMKDELNRFALAVR